MTKTIPLIIAFTLTGCGVFLDECDPASIFYTKLSPEKLAECEANAETGGPEDATLICEEFGELCQINRGQVGWFEPTARSYFERSVETCESTSKPFPHVANWGVAVTAEYSGPTDMFCTDHPSNAPSSIIEPWEICKSHDWDVAPHPYYPATMYPDGGLVECDDYLESAGWCTYGLVAIGEGIHDVADWPETWTCACVSDADCQAGAVCEAGYFMDGLWPSPSLCTWDVPGHSRPAGPSVYGLSEWSEGVTVRPGNVTMTSAMFISAVGKAASLWDDDQSFGPDGLITRCGNASLCTHLGLGVGDRVSIELEDVARVSVGDPVTVTLHRAGGEISSFNFEVL